ncbi:efflux transporter outer membrane subunit [Sphingomonas faeni]|uniref:efflux transporter outer membrane subunit n=1 Tax=Sphingomonas faeni TaxID=185950 RepID=UPI00277E87A2|nr:TolC family protein [Sphingomonas faeni]MDQ0839311.1 NodT family efflux transporter outer membrane factor (OMF) lipoprotein [Sphingomonas faeni]
MTRRLLATVLLLGGCTLGPDYHPPIPSTQVRGSLVFIPSGATTADTPSRWWELYEDHVLNDLVSKALTANTDLRVAEANLDAAQAAFRVTGSARLPATGVTAGAVYGRTATQTEVADALGGKAKNRLIDSSGFQLAYEVDLFGRVRRSLQAARADAEAAAASRDAVRLMVAGETIRAYVSACAAAHQIEVAQRSIALAEQQRTIVGRQLAAGGATRFDLTRSTTVLAQTNATLPIAVGERRAALFALAAMMGRTPADVPPEASRCRAAPTLKQAVPVGDGGALLERRPDVRLAERRMAAASARIGVAKADLLPRISLFGSVSSAAPDGNGLGTRPATSFGLGPLISWSFPNVAAAKGRLEAARASDRAAVAGYDGAVLTALKEVEQALARYSASLDRSRELDMAQRSAAESFALARARLDAGAISQLDLLTAEEALIGTQTAVAASTAEQTDLLVTLFKALGGGWQGDEAKTSGRPGRTSGRPTGM